MSAVLDAPTLFDHVGAVLRAWSARLGLVARLDEIEAAYDTLCRASLALTAGRRPLRASHLNADGTPFQLALALGAASPALQFLADAAPVGSHGAERLHASQRSLARLAHGLGAAAQLAAVQPWIAALVPDDDADVLACEAGALWLGAAFAATGRARLKIYANARIGAPAVRWRRLEALAARVDGAADWRALVEAMPGAQPLGAAVLIGADAAPSVRLYLTSEGVDLAGALAFARHCGGAPLRELVADAAARLFDASGRTATRALVVSAALGPRGLRHPKVEFCAPWIFDSDAQAASRCARWLSSLGLDTAAYEHALALCAGETPDARACRAHAYVGIGLDSGRPAASLYLNPAAGARP
jgi:hypothetical protein